MEEFFPNQRYTSKGEPELGIGILTEAGNRKVQVYFPLSNEKRQYAVESAPLRRVIFKPGDTIIDTNNQALLVHHVELEGELYMYYSKDRKLSEAELGSMSVTHGVEDRLLAGDVDRKSVV